MRPPVSLAFAIVKIVYRAENIIDANLVKAALADADIFHISTRRFWTPEWPEKDPDRGLAAWVKEFTDAPVIAVGSVGLDIDVMATLTGEEAAPSGSLRIADLIRRFERGDFDLISIGRSLIGDPDWVAKMRDGRAAEIRPFRRADLEWLT